ncbi:electron transport complex subunit RsxC [Catenovulum sp. 2E275]|uniref:electron transport complex subunit RsxC n=1 Tax=Catenovulum sp. 2E275 TaxID=2980497 RepID=UPI0021D04FC9|nr:electron transport complex subunit RsxC [Catenovulum sp. 2E275]MCU4676482.1 electron transport complex subunit RsxC [Catenovulum sp. 2E275]
MDSLIEKIKSGYLWDFPGGVFPPERKKLSNHSPIKQLPLADEYIIPVKQHIGHPANIVVQIGDSVLKGQALTQVQGPMELPVHAPTSGEIIAIEPRISAHPSGLEELAIVLKPDSLDNWCEKSPTPNYFTLSKVELLDKLKQAGISGLGGASFPTYVKQSNSQPIELLIINGVECEPYITADDMLMREHANEIVSGIEIFTHLLQPKLVVIAIENNKPEAIAAIEAACSGKTKFVVRAIPTKYPAGGEKQLIQVITGQEVPSRGITADLGIISQNIGTAYAAYKAIVQGEPLIERVVTVTGEQVNSAQNVWARIGTPVQFLLDNQGYKPLKKPRVIMGGPMMGFALHSLATPVAKMTNCILAPSDKALPAPENEQACIRCGYCADACPASLLPQQLYWHSKAKEYDKAQDYKLFDCIECGACAYVCPSEIPLVQYYRIAKADIKTEQLEHEKAEKAKERFNARNERLEREKQERLDKHQQAAESRKKAMAKDQGAQDKVAAALARVQAKKQAKETPEQQETTNKTAQNVADSAVSQDTSAKATAAAAIARAKAKKAAQAKAEQLAKDTDKTPTTEDSAQAKAKAIAEKIKAKRQAEAQAGSDAPAEPDNAAVKTESDNKDTEQGLTPAQIKAKAIAEKIKAKRQAETQAGSDAPAEADTVAGKTESDNKDTEQGLTPAQIKAKAIADKIKAKRQAEAQTGSDVPADPDNAAGKTESDNKDTEQSLTPAQIKAKAIADKIKAKRQAEAQAGSNEQAEPENLANQTETASPKNEPEPSAATDVKSTETAENELTEAEIRQQRVKAAIAKAKAKKQALGDK